MTEVTQVDLDAAAELIEAYWSGADASMMRLAKDTRNGHRQGAFPRAFARHRESALATARAEAEALKERADALARQADEWEGKYAAVSEMNAQLRGEVERLGRALREIDRMNDHPKWFRQSVNDIIGYALSKGPTQ